MKGLPKPKKMTPGPKMSKLFKKKKLGRMAKEDTYQNAVKES